MGSRLTQSPNKNPRTIFPLYESGQVEALERLWRERPLERTDSLVVALAPDIETKLTERGIAFSSGRRYKQPFPNLLATEDEMMAAFFADPRWAAFEYRGIALRTTFLFMFRLYLQRVFYYGNLLISIVEAHPRVERLILFAPGGGIVSAVAGGLAKLGIEAVVDCARTIAAARGIAVEIMPLSLSRTSLRNTMSLSLFTLRRVLFGLVLRVWNVAIILLRRPRHPRLLISDYWKHVGSSVESLPAGECIFIDRMEIRNINWRTLLRYRMRFVHSADFLSRRMRRRARKSARRFAQEWSDMRSTIAPIFICRGYALDSLLLNAVDDIIRGFEKAVCEIEGTYALYEHLQPDVVVLRASVSRQTHFSVLPLVAKEYGIPSLELQHGLEYLGPGSLSREHAAEYMAVYGPLVKKELLLLGYAPERVREIGSPRFDTHQENATTIAPHHFTVLCIAPDIRPFEIYDLYSAEDYFAAIAKAVEAIPNARAIIKLRSESTHEGFLLKAAIAKAFSTLSYSIASSEPLPELFARTDVVVSCYSTAILEALQCGMTVIIPALNPVDAMVVNFHFSRYPEEGALYIAHAYTELAETLAELAAHPARRNSMRAKAQAFLVHNFCFDGRASERIGELIKRLALKRNGHTNDTIVV